MYGLSIVQGFTLSPVQIIRCSFKYFEQCISKPNRLPIIFNPFQMFKFNVVVFLFLFLLFFFGGGGTVCLYHMERTLGYHGLTFVNDGFVFTLYNVSKISLLHHRSRLNWTVILGASMHIKQFMKFNSNIA